MNDSTGRPSRRTVLSSSIALVSGLAAGAALTRQGDSTKSEAGTVLEPVLAGGPHQAGVTRPSTPQRNALITIADVETEALPEALESVGRRILELTGSAPSDILPDGGGDLTVLIGLGSRALAAFDPALPDLLEMPAYLGDDALPEHLLGGDLLLSVNSSDPGALEPTRAEIARLLPGFTPRWSEYGFRGPGEDGVARNPFGFHDGVQIARTEEELEEGVWIPDGPLAGGTICVMRRFDLDVPALSALPVEEQEAVMGRKKVTGVPLSGGELLDVVDVSAKHPDGELILPMNAHARAAHPSFTGSPLMLRRSYNTVRGGSGEGAQHGHVFTAFQNDIRTFVLTQQRMDEMDDLTNFITPTATAAFAILPGFDTKRPLGSTLI